MITCHVKVKGKHPASMGSEEVRQFVITATDAAEVEQRLKPFERPGYKISWDVLEPGLLYELGGHGVSVFLA